MRRRPSAASGRTQSGSPVNGSRPLQTDPCSGLVSVGPKRPAAETFGFTRGKGAAVRLSLTPRCAGRAGRGTGRAAAVRLSPAGTDGPAWATGWAVEGLSETGWTVEAARETGCAGAGASDRESP